jgi:retron-type reverse transcriptase
MHRIGDLWKHVTSFENLYCATFQVLRGKRGQCAAGDFFFHLERNLLQLQQELRTQTYRPGVYRTFWITDPKRRLISAAPFRDRVVHHALVRMMEPIFDRRFLFQSYACRMGKGTHRALRQFTDWARSSRYVLKMDIAKFFPSLDHAVLKERIRRTIKDPQVLWLCELIIDGSNEQEEVVQHFPGDDLFTPVTRRHGIPIGNLTSQFFANVYLDALDHFVKEQLRVKRYLRYVDDFCCFADDKLLLTEVRAAIAAFLLGLRLRLNEGKSRIRQVKEGVEFLGFVVFPTHLRLNQTAVRRQRRRLRRLQRAYASGALRWAEVAASLRAWNAYAAHGTTWQLRADVFRRTVFVSSPGARENPLLIPPLAKGGSAKRGGICVNRDAVACTDSKVWA